MDDLVLRVKQVAQYPFAATAAPTDALLIQQGGLGGSYAYINPAGITGALSARIDTLQIQLSGFNQTVADLSLSWTDQFTQTIAHITDTTVWSFNGRRGDVCLTLWDIVEAGGASSQNTHLTGYPTTSNIQFATQTDSQIANTEFVQRAIAWRTKELLTTHPFVFAWNGRIGRVCMTFDDVEAVLRDGNPTVPDQLESDFSARIANTRFVHRLIDDIRIDLDALEKIVYAEIDASSLATKTYVQDTFVTLQNSTLGGYTTAPTPPAGTSNAQVATTQFVMNAVAESVAGVATWNGRSGNVVLDSGDLTGVGGALINSPAFTGSPTAPTQPTGTSNTTLATTAFVLNEISAIDAGVVTFNNRSGAVTFLLSDVTGVGGAPIASPNFSGTPTAVTATAGTSTTQLATTAFVTAAVAAAAGVSSFEGRTGAVQLTANDISARGGALLASPVFTGQPLAPTAVAGTSTTQIATTAFVQNAISAVGSGFLMLTGGTMTGPLALAANATLPMQAVPLQQLNSSLSGYLPLTGGTIDGALTLTGTLLVESTNASMFNGGLTVNGNNGINAVNGPITANGLMQGTQVVSRIAGNGASFTCLNTSASSACGIYGSASGAQLIVASMNALGGPIANWQSHTAGGFLPSIDNAQVCGMPGTAWQGVASYGFNQQSDPRLKQMLDPLGNALGVVLQIPVHRFTYTRDTARHPHTGFDASEVLPVFPDGVVIGTDEDKTLGISLGDMLGVLWEAVQELTTRLEALEAA